MKTHSSLPLASKCRWNFQSLSKDTNSTQCLWHMTWGSDIWRKSSMHVCNDDDDDGGSGFCSKGSAYNTGYFARAAIQKRSRRDNEISVMLKSIHFPSAAHCVSTDVQWCMCVLEAWKDVFVQHWKSLQGLWNGPILFYALDVAVCMPSKYFYMKHSTQLLPPIVTDRPKPCDHFKARFPA